MALAGPSCLEIAPIPAIHHSHTHIEDPGSSQDDGVKVFSDADRDKGKHREFLDPEREMDAWRESGLIEVGMDAETDWGLQALFDEEELGDAFTQLAMTVEQMAREVEGVPLPPPPPVMNYQKTSTLRRRFLSAFRNNQKSTPLPRVCVVCQDPILDKELEIRVPCGHFYDKECIVSLFQASTKDESLFPPRCCKLKISLRKVQMNFPPWLLKEFAEKSKEFGTVKRVYCDRVRCSRFLGKQVEGITWLVSGPKTYTCTCGTVTCTRCKKAHQNYMKHFCDKTDDDGTEVVVALGKVEGWARCPKCRTMIELNMGCYHMTCLCRAQFCYLCQARWKTCSCKQWDETRLVAAAEERIDHALELMDAARRPAPVLARLRHNHGVMPQVLPIRVQPDRQELIQAAVDELRVNHDCQHGLWRYRDGGGRCVGCSDVLDRYVYHCMGCHTIACNRCRLNRF